MVLEKGAFQRMQKGKGLEICAKVSFFGSIIFEHALILNPRNKHPRLKIKIT